MHAPAASSIHQPHIAQEVVYLHTIQWDDTKRACPDIKSQFESLCVIPPTTRAPRPWPPPPPHRRRVRPQEADPALLPTSLVLPINEIGPSSPLGDRKMGVRKRRSPLTTAPLLLLVAVVVVGLLPGSLPSAGAFVPPPRPSPSLGRAPAPRANAAGRSLTSLSAMNRRNKFNKQKDLAAKMAEAKRLRELAEAGVDPNDDAAADGAGGGSKGEELSAAEIKLRNDRKRFEDLLDGSLSGGGGDYDRGHYLTEAQEDENADAVCEFAVAVC